MASTSGKILRHIQVVVNTEEEKMAIGSKIHDQLAGNQDYVDSAIVLNVEKPYEVNMYVFDDLKGPMPEIRI